MRTSQEQRIPIGRLWTALRNLVRRMVVKLSGGGRWQLEGFEGEPHEEIEHFGGVGFHSRPAAGADAEAIVLRVGGEGGHPVIVATRDESARIELDADETAIYTSSSMVRIRADGTIEIGSIGGTFNAVALKSDVQEAVDKFNGHVHADPTTGWTGGPLDSPAHTPVSMSNPVGTTKARLE